MPESITAVQQLAFQGSGLSKIEIPANTETIGREAFQSCASLAEVKIGEKVSVIEWSAFQNCDALTAVTIPDSVTALGEYCFADCELLQEIQMGYGLTKLVSYTFHQCPSLEEVILSGRMNTLESSAFTNCINLKKLTIPRSVQSIGNNAFSYPTKMTVYGVPGTYAEEWANSVGAAFVGQDKPATAVSLSAGTATLNKGGTLILTLSVTPADYTDEVTWKSSNTSVATVSDTGVVTAQNLGNAVIQVNVGNVRASCMVTVL